MRVTRRAKDSGAYTADKIITISIIDICQLGSDLKLKINSELLMAYSWSSHTVQNNGAVVT